RCRRTVAALPSGSARLGASPTAGGIAKLKLPVGSGDASAEVTAGADAELGEHVAQVPLDGAGADEQLGGSAAMNRRSPTPTSAGHRIRAPRRSAGCLASRSSRPPGGLCPAAGPAYHRGGGVGGGGRGGRGGRGRGGRGE